MAQALTIQMASGQHSGVPLRIRTDDGDVSWLRHEGVVGRGRKGQDRGCSLTIVEIFQHLNNQLL